MACLRRLLACALALAGLGVGSLARAQTPPALPSAELVTAPMVSPSAAWAFYGTGATHTAGEAAWSATPPEIAAQARSLGANRADISDAQYAQNVFDYVRNNIATEFRFGLAKGGRGALIDQSGTPFDQAQLMVQLLRQRSTLSASYQVGTISPSVQQFGQWTGFVTGLTQANQTFTVNAQAACQFLADGGIPAIVNGVSDCTAVSGNLSSVTLGHIWIAVNGVLYDPSFKIHTLKTGVDIAAAVGCGSASSPTCGSTVMAAAMTGATTTTVGGNAALQNLNEAAVTTQLDLYAQSLESYVKSNIPTAQLDDIIGGAEINTTYQPNVGAALPYVSTAQYSWSGDIPDQFRTSFTLQYQSSVSTINQSFYADETANRRLRLMGDSIYVDDTMIKNGISWGSAPNFGSIILSVAHPYAASSPSGVIGSYADESITFSLLSFVSPSTIIQQWGDSSLSTKQFFTDLQNADPSPYNGAGATMACSAANITSSACRGEEQMTLGASLFVQQTLADQIDAALTGVKITHHHELGVISDTPITYAGQTFTIQTASSVNSTSNTASQRQAAFETSAGMEAMLEGAAGQQATDSYEPFSAAALFVMANRGGRL